MPDYDALIIGAGHNGLVAAAYLAKAGLRVLVLERRSILGGAAATEEIFPGFRVNTGACDAGLFLPEIVNELSLEKHGLRFLQSPALICSLQPNGEALTLWRDPEQSVNEIAHISPQDAARFPDYLKQVSRMASILAKMERLSPPNLPEYSLPDLLPWLRVAFQVKRLGDRDMMEFLRLLPLPAGDFLDEWFQSPTLKAALGTSGVTGTLGGPKSAGTTLMLLYQAAGAQNGLRASQFVQGGIGMLSQALASAARQWGAEIHTGACVARILLEDHEARGVALENGERISTGAVISSADPQHTYFDLVGAQHLEVRLVREVKNIRFRASLARLNLALSGLPHFNGIRPNDQERLSAHIQICPDLDYLESAFEQAKYGRFSEQPYLDMVIPTLLDSSLAPRGQHLLAVDVYYAPYRLETATWEDQRQLLADRVIALLANYAPGIENLILNRQVLTPLDLEREYSLPHGDIFHGQMALDQLIFMRPVPGCPGYHSAIKNLYLCGAGSHPGGGVSGAPGYNAAREFLKTI